MVKKLFRDSDLVLSREQVRACDRVAIEHFGINGLVLMENAGGAAAKYILLRLGDRRHDQVCIVAGTGNNGGDGFVVGRHLSNKGINVDIIICGEREHIKGDALSNLRIIEQMSLPISYITQTQPEAIAASIERCAGKAILIVDAMLGTGTSGPPREPIRTAIATINRMEKTVIALDIPSGLDCDSGQPLELAIRATATVTFAAMKKGFLTLDAAHYTGSVMVACIGINTAWLLR